MERQDERTVHGLREGVTLAKGWLELLLSKWETLDDHQRQSMVAGALLGASRIESELQVMEGTPRGDIILPEERVAQALLNLVETDAEAG